MDSAQTRTALFRDSFRISAPEFFFFFDIKSLCFLYKVTLESSYRVFPYLVLVLSNRHPPPALKSPL